MSMTWVIINYMLLWHLCILCNVSPCCRMWYNLLSWQLTKASIPLTVDCKHNDISLHIIFVAHLFDISSEFMFCDRNFVRVAWYGLIVLKVLLNPSSPLYIFSAVNSTVNGAIRHYLSHLARDQPEYTTCNAGPEFLQNFKFCLVYFVLILFSDEKTQGHISIIDYRELLSGLKRPLLFSMQILMCFVHFDIWASSRSLVVPLHLLHFFLLCTSTKIVSRLCPFPLNPKFSARKR